MEFQPFRLSNSINTAQTLAMNQMRMSEFDRSARARDGLQRAVSAGTPEAMSAYRSEFPEEAQAYEANSGKANAAKLENEIKRVDFLGNVASGVKDEASYQEGVSTLQRAGFDTSSYPKNYDQAWLSQKMEQTLSLKDRLSLAAKDLKLVEIYDPKSPTGTRFVKESDAIGQPGKMPSGMNIEFGPDGRPTRISSGRGSAASGPGGMSKPTQSDVEGNILKSGDTMSQLKSIQNMYRPEFQKIGNRLNMSWDALKNKAGADLDPTERKNLEDYTKYRAEAGQLFSLTLKNLSGVAVNPTEFERAKAWLPTPGSGVFDGDSPVELEAKRQRFEDFTRKALIKHNYILKKGIGKDDIDVDDMPAIVQKRGDELEARLKSRYQGVELKRAVKSALSDEFGFGLVK